MGERCEYPSGTLGRITANNNSDAFAWWAGSDWLAKPAREN